MSDPNDRPVGGREEGSAVDANTSTELAPRPPINAPIHPPQAEPQVARTPHAPQGAQYLQPAPAQSSHHPARRVHPAQPPAAPQIWLAGEHSALSRPGLLGVLEGLLRQPANLMYELSTRSGTHGRLLALAVGAMCIAGLFVGMFSGGFQLLAVPLKLSFGLVLCGLICLPSLYILSCLSGGDFGLRETSSALLAGISLTSVILLGFAPVSWVFGQATESGVLMGAIHLFFFAISVHFGLRLTRRALANVGGRPIRALGLWSLVFVFVMLQMSTTLRPLVGPFEGLALADKQFFLVHWFS